MHQAGDEDGGAGARADKAGEGFQAVPLEGHQEGEGEVVAHLYRLQPAQALQSLGPGITLTEVRWTRLFRQGSGLVKRDSRPVTGAPGPVVRTGPRYDTMSAS